MNKRLYHFNSLPTPMVSAGRIAIFVLITFSSTIGCTDIGRVHYIDSSSQKRLQIAERGQSLRRAIDETYKRLEESKAIKPMLMGGNSITDIVLKFIPLGMPFDEAEDTLRAAGFVIEPRQKSYLSSNIITFAVIDRYATSLFGFLGKSSIVIVMEPANQSNWKEVGKMEAEIVISFL